MSIESRKVNLRITLLRLLKSREMYGYEILKKLRRDTGTAHSSFLYGKLREMERDGLLKSHSLGKLKGPERMSYQITEKGQRWLKGKLVEAISTIIDFYSDYISQFPPERVLPSDLLRSTGETRNFVLVANSSSPVTETIMRTAMKRLEKARLYFVKPPDIDVRWDLKRPMTLDGTFSEIPLRDGLVDILVAMRPPKAELPKAIREFRRVVAKNGRVRIFYPNTLIKQTFTEPLSFSDFITRANQDYWHEELIDEKELLHLLEKHFGSCIKDQDRMMPYFVYTAMAPALP